LEASIGVRGDLGGEGSVGVVSRDVGVVSVGVGVISMGVRVVFGDEETVEHAGVVGAVDMDVEIGSKPFTDLTFTSSLSLILSSVLA
jgi:hypothetical protein